jgi:glycosyltransferase involved in cell wall biosynthesis
MRILMTADTIGGGWTHALELAGALAPIGVDVVLATMGGAVSPAQARGVARLGNVDLVESRFALEWMPDPWRDVDAAGDWLLAIAQRWRPDLVHLHGYSHATLPFRLPIVVVAHACVATWFHAVRGCDPPMEFDEYRLRVAAGLRAADAVVAPTAAILRAVLAAYRIDRSGHVIANARSAQLWRPTTKEPFVLAAGRLSDEAKGLPELVAAAPHVEWPIYVAGPTEAPPAVRALGRRAPEDVAEYAGRASIFALPARYEPFGLSIVEAALAGCALVLGDIDTLREIWGDDAVYVPPGDAATLADRINALVRDPVHRGTLGAVARARALLMSPQRMAASYLALYEELRAPVEEVA